MIYLGLFSSSSSGSGFFCSSLSRCLCDVAASECVGSEANVFSNERGDEEEGVVVAFVGSHPH